MPFPVVPPSAELQGQFNNATASGDPAAVSALKDSAVGTTLVGDINNSVQVMDRAAAPVRRILEAADNKGGIATPQGRLAMADAVNVESQLKDWQQLHQPLSFGKALVNAALGVPDPWKSATYGRKETRMIYDQNGDGAFATFYQNNPNTPAYVIDPRTNTIVPPKEYEARGFQKYTSPAESPFAQAQGEVFKANLIGLNETKGLANINSAVGSQLSTLARQLQTDSETLATRYGLDNDTLNELSGLTNRLLTDDTKISNSLQNLTQGTTSESRSRSAKELSEVGAFGNLKIVGTDAKGQFIGEDGKTYSASDLTSKAQNFLRSRDRSTQISQARAELVNSTYYKSLPDAQAKTLAENMFANVVRMKELTDRLQKENKTLPFVTLDVPFQKGQPYQVGIANAIVQEANAEHMVAFGRFMDKEYERNRANPPSRGQLEAAYTRTPGFQEINAKAAQRIKEVEGKTFGTTPVKVTVGAASPETVPAAPAPLPGAEAPTPAVTGGAAQPQRTQDRSVTRNRPAPTTNHSSSFLESLKGNKK